MLKCICVSALEKFPTRCLWCLAHARPLCFPHEYPRPSTAAASQKRRMRKQIYILHNITYYKALNLVRFHSAKDLAADRPPPFLFYFWFKWSIPVIKILNNYFRYTKKCQWAIWLKNIQLLWYVKRRLQLECLYSLSHPRYISCCILFSENGK